MLLNRDQIAALIPHGNGMCMLDEVVSWSTEAIHCRSINFAARVNPLFENNQLESVLLLEYAAQAAAVHGALIQEGPLSQARQAYVGAVKNVNIVQPFSDCAMPIDVEANCLLNADGGAIYDVLAKQGSVILISGRLILNRL